MTDAELIGVVRRPVVTLITVMRMHSLGSSLFISVCVRCAVAGHALK